jgi:hypothetical protein
MTEREPSFEDRLAAELGETGRFGQIFMLGNGDSYDRRCRGGEKLYSAKPAEVKYVPPTYVFDDIPTLGANGELVTSTGDPLDVLCRRSGQTLSMKRIDEYIPGREGDIVVVRFPDGEDPEATYPGVIYMTRYEGDNGEYSIDVRETVLQVGLPEDLLA